MLAPSRRLAYLVALLVLPSTTRADDLEIFFIDVQGGAATLIVTPEHESILLDTGWPGLEDRDPKRIEHVLKNVAGLDHLDHLITTHWHMDHYGGVGGLAKRVRIDHFWDRGLPSDGDTSQDFPDGPKSDEPLLVAYLAAAKDKRKVLKPGDDFLLKGHSKAKVLVGSGKVAGGNAATANEACEAEVPAMPVDTSDNARSLGLLFALGRFQFLDCGDLTWNVEAQLACPTDRVRPTAGLAPTDAVDLYQVTHHGLETSNNPLLVQTLQPTVSIMNNGPRKGGSASVVRMLRTIPSLEANYQLHRNVQTGPEDNVAPEFIANAEESGGQFIRVTVAEDGSSYRVRFGADGPPREFVAK